MMILQIMVKLIHSTITSGVLIQLRHTLKFQIGILVLMEVEEQTAVQVPTHVMKDKEIATLMRTVLIV